MRFVRFSACAAFVFSLPQDLKNKEKAERDARTQVAEAQHTNIKDEIAKQVGAGLPTNPTAPACVPGCDLNARSKESKQPWSLLFCLCSGHT